MTPDQQEALSYQHFRGFWLVPLESGKLAMFDHPNGKLLDIADFPWSITAAYDLFKTWAAEAEKRREEVKRTPISLPALPHLDTSGIDL